MKNLKKLMVLSVAALVLSACGGGGSSSQESSQQSSSQQSSSQQSSSQQSSSQESSQQSSSQQSSSQESSASESSQSSSAEAKYERKDEDDVYDAILGDFDDAYAAAVKVSDNDQRYVQYAYAEAKLLASATMLPTITQGGAYAMTRVAFRTVPYVTFGFDSDRMRTAVIVEAGDNAKDQLFINQTDRAALKAQWEEAYNDAEKTYDPAAYLVEKGYTLAKKFVTTFTDSVTTLDPMYTYYQSDTESLVNAIEGLVEWDNLGRLQPRLAKEWKVSEDGLKYTFTLRDDIKWYTNAKAAVRNIVANDFVKGFQHTLDVADETEFYLLAATIKGAAEYAIGSHDTDWFNANVGYKALDEKTIEITLDHAEPYFLSRLTYSPFMPICPEKFEDEGGAFGVEAFAAAVADENYNYANVEDLGSTYYNSAFVPTKITGGTGGEIIYSRNENYFDNAHNNFDELKWIYDKGDKPLITYDSVCKGEITATGLSEAAGTLAKAKEDGYFDKYSYVSDTNATTFLMGMNTNRGTFKSGETVVSPQSEAQKIATNNAMSSLNFRRALQHAWDREVYNSKTKGTAIAKLSLRNLYTQPNFVKLSKEVTFEGKTFKANTLYYQIVEAYLEEALGFKVNLEDGQDGWYNPELAKTYLNLAKAELGDNWKKVELDVVYISSSVNNTAQAQAFKASIEGALGEENVTVNLIGTENTADFYAAGYRAGTGEKGNYDVFYGSGWGPDFQDPSSYLGTFAASGDGSMIKLTGNY